MNAMLAIVRKELRSYFLSPVALIFIGTFLLASLFSFFWVEGFFSRNVADTRPLFRWLPVLLIFLVPAVGMRLWSEEDRMGTLELLQTYPLSASSMVLGKFFAGLALVTTALALTLPIAVTVNLLGNLDWGPVWGGYIATLLLAATYLSITLCVSSITSSQLVALIFGSVLCGALYIMGSETVTSLFGHRVGEILRGVGAGSRFDSILRGVIDLRDLVYYLSTTAFFLTLNTLLITSRKWSDSAAGRSTRTSNRWGIRLVALNVIAINVLVYPVRGARIDLTEDKLYSISDVTKNLLEGLDEPLLVRGYFSGKTHPLLAPLVPRIRDLIEEYGAVGGKNIRAEFVDPTTDEALEKEAAQDYGITSVPFQFASRHESSVVNSYFHVLVRYGDQYEVLGFDDLIEVKVHGMEIQVQLRNLEYDLTRTIQKSVYGFQSLPAIFARLPAKAKLTAYISQKGLPEDYQEVPQRIEKIAKEFAEAAGDRFTWQVVDPLEKSKNLEQTVAQLAKSKGIKPFALSLFSNDIFYLHLYLEVGDYSELLRPSENFAEADIRKELTASLKRAGPGFLKTVGIVEPKPGEGLSFAQLREILGQTYKVESVDLEESRIPGNIDVLLLLDPRKTEESALYAIDQFMMRGGSVLIATSSQAVDSQQRQELTIKEVDSGLTKSYMEHFGITLGEKVVLDTQNAAFPIPVTRSLGGFTVREIQMLQYPAFVDVRADGMAQENPALAGIPSLVFHWASPLKLKQKNSVEADSDQNSDPNKVESQTNNYPEPLFFSSPDSWALKSPNAQPDFANHPKIGWETKEPREKRVLAASVRGPLQSYFKNTESIKREGAEDGETETKVNVIETSPERSRLIVLGSASFVSDFAIGLSRQGTEAVLSNLQLVQNLVDWCLEDAELLKIRARSTFARPLSATSLSTRQWFEWGNYGIAILSVLIIGMMSLNRRKNAVPLELPAPPVSYNADNDSNEVIRKNDQNQNGQRNGRRGAA